MCQLQPPDLISLEGNTVTKREDRTPLRASTSTISTTLLSVCYSMYGEHDHTPSFLPRQNRKWEVGKEEHILSSANMHR